MRQRRIAAAVARQTHRLDVAGRTGDDDDLLCARQYHAAPSLAKIDVTPPASLPATPQADTTTAEIDASAGTSGARTAKS
ncbi:MAG: hypothetical protein LBK99_10940 [Opitutaceae bacterium]|nr:hypothetical protein [Opitutaceae bacterium]